MSRTVSGNLYRLGYQSRRPRRKPILTSMQRKHRLGFVKKYGLWSKSSWRRVLWSDKVTFSVTSNRG